MPAVSKKQFKYAFVLHEEGKISKSELKKFTHGVNYQSLPAKARQIKKRRKSKKRRGSR